ncbi:MAG: TIGR04053 family radical SAM/SPASM domain-containing protein [Saccharolobus sp.]|uniref:Radical SAM heme biosynthesis protein AhbD, Fe-coproporphyrin III decarboxylase n=4 Tax=Saccharolobus TaxID=2100760 RepID=A0A8F5BQ21_SACSH|nr:TIGR04053 family radical SAM/SPASM domain-containing protein [Saccharolobus shibatae]MCH4814714.1 TIGR04053 family radical SAM/SPASM domain-containing protein [Saccharolobus shibatae]QXJ29230.1 Radical SAM heme biosynthesis protein AhbD, Fe-coproporphyrin III decarboxylase [Saccharolobus shibatae B12]QXJ32476.1 Radical SAM heme biosynthesis protein AhbD, Fe-coproporphyrin III decarboxylase [Saccharolobus shibatae]
MPFENTPHLVFWEVTKACPLSCKHCRANAIDKPLPGELSTKESKKLLEDIARFGKVVIVFTGGDPLSRSDIFELMEYAKSLGLVVSIAPSPSYRLSDETMKMISNYARYMSISLDGATSQTHDWLRGLGSYKYALRGIALGLKYRIQVQVNTLVWKKSYSELPFLVKLLKELGVKIWEVFFLIPVGRGVIELDIPKEKYKDVIDFLVETTRYDLVVRTVEAPFFRRAKLEYTPDTIKNNELISKLRELLGDPVKDVDKSVLPTRDGSGVIFIGYNGDVYPSGFLPLYLGNVRKESIVDIYRKSEVLKIIKDGRFNGKCGVCKFNNICGGSRARAFAVYNNPFAEDPMCPY